MQSVLYTKIDTDVHDQLRAVAELAGVSIAKTTEAMLATSMGVEHVLGDQVKRAIKKHRSGK